MKNAKVRTSEAVAFLEAAVGDWKNLEFDNFDLEDVRAELERFKTDAQAELLAALKQCRSVLQTCQHEIKDRLGQHVIGNRIADASEAITKAEGVKTPEASTHLTHISEGLPHG